MDAGKSLPTITKTTENTIKCSSNMHREYLGVCVWAPRGRDLQSSCWIRPSVIWHRKQTSIECAIDNKENPCSQIFVIVENGTQTT